MKNSERAVMVFAVGLLLFVLAYLGLPWQRISAWMDKPESPAWVQAVGSVVALLIALGIATWQHLALMRRDDQRAKREDARLLAILWQIAHTSGLMADTLLSDLEKLPTDESLGLYQSGMRPVLLDLQSQLQPLPLHALPNAHLVDAVVALRVSLAMLMALYGGENATGKLGSRVLLERVAKRTAGTAKIVQFMTARR